MATIANERKTLWKKISKMKWDLSGCFGMCEMEQAAAVILYQLYDCKSVDTEFSASTFLGNQQQLDGFVELVFCGWLAHGKYNGCFKVQTSFLMRIHRQLSKKVKQHGR